MRTKRGPVRKSRPAPVALRLLTISSLAALLSGTTAGGTFGIEKEFLGIDPPTRCEAGATASGGGSVSCQFLCVPGHRVAVTVKDRFLGAVVYGEADCDAAFASCWGRPACGAVSEGAAQLGDRILGDCFGWAIGSVSFVGLYVKCETLL